MVMPFKPTKEELLAAVNKTVPDVIAPGLKILFCGINPGLYTAAVGHHFARPGNRFWPALRAGGLTDRIFSPFEEEELLKCGYGITNLVSRATVMVHELTREELIEGRKRLENKISIFRPKCVAILGIGSYRKAFGRPKAVPGMQPEKIDGSAIWLLPNPSGLNAAYKPGDFARMFRELHLAVEEMKR